MENARIQIVLLHGFAANRLMMWRLGNQFRRAGYRTHNWGYNSWFKSIDAHATALAARLRILEEDADVDRIDFVTHSMGSIVARAALLAHLPRKCGRWVMLAPPNRGSYAANRLARPLGWLMKPIDELRTAEDSYVNRLPVPQGVEMAVVQAMGDFIVREPLTRIAGEKDRFVVPGLHSAMLLRQDVAKQSLHFLEHGCFDSE